MQSVLKYVLVTLKGHVCDNEFDVWGIRTGGAVFDGVLIFPRREQPGVVCPEEGDRFPDLRWIRQADIVSGIKSQPR
jgi:hypothetical protein